MSPGPLSAMYAPAGCIVVVSRDQATAWNALCTCGAQGWGARLSAALTLEHARPLDERRRDAA